MEESMKRKMTSDLQRKSSRLGFLDLRNEEEDENHLNIF